MDPDFIKKLFPKGMCQEGMINNLMEMSNMDKMRERFNLPEMTEEERKDFEKERADLMRESPLQDGLGPELLDKLTDKMEPSFLKAFGMDEEADNFIQDHCDRLQDCTLLIGISNVQDNVFTNFIDLDQIQVNSYGRKKLEIHYKNPNNEIMVNATQTSLFQVLFTIECVKVK